MTQILFRNNRGIALLITLTIITLLLVVTLELNRNVRPSVASSAATRDRLSLLYMASSGIHAGMAMLVKDRIESDFDSLQEDWTNPEKINEVLGDIPFKTGRITLKITDELSKIQVNALVSFPEGKNFNIAQQNMWNRFLENFTSIEASEEDMRPAAVINSIKDWLDSGDDDAITGLSGAETDYYQNLDKPYQCKNGLINHIGELSLIKGINPGFLHGKSIRKNGTPSIASYLTIYGQTDMGGNTYTYHGKININTADLPVISALLSSESRDLAQVIYEYRKESTTLEYIHDLSKPGWYKDVPGGGGIEINPDLITTFSDIFSLESTATIRNQQIAVTAVAKREKDSATGNWRCRILNWQAK